LAPPSARCTTLSEGATVATIVLLGSILWAMVTEYVLSLGFPCGMAPSSARRIVIAAGVFGLLYPAAMYLADLLPLISAVASSIPPSLRDQLQECVPAAVACLPLAGALALECRSLAAGVTPLAALAIILLVMGATSGLDHENFVIAWYIIAPPIWVTLTFVGLVWVVRPDWPLAPSPQMLCGSCGYSRAGLTGTLCPECGSPLPAPEADAAALATADAAPGGAPTPAK
jgi:hypothetical protein